MGGYIYFHTNDIYYMNEVIAGAETQGVTCLTLSNMLKASLASCICCLDSGGIGKSLIILLKK